MENRIPDHAKKVFEGIMFDVYHWDQEMFDGSTQTFEAISKLGSSQVIAITTEKKIVLLNEEQPHVGKFISIPGGHVERDETPLENAKKELREEVGMESDKWEEWIEANIGSKIDWPSNYYIARDCVKVDSQNLEEAGEKIEPYEVDFDTFIEHTQREDFRNKFLQITIFKMIHTEGELEKFRKLLLD